MYTITSFDGPEDRIGKVIFDQRTNTVISSGVLTLKEADIDDLDITLNPKSVEYGNFKPLMTYVEVKQDGNIIFRGRVLKPKRAMDSSGKFTQAYTIESVSAFLLDTVQRFREVHDTTPADFFRMIIEKHNEQVPYYKQFKVGIVNVSNSTDNVYRFIDYANTFETLKDKLISRLGGYLRIRLERDANYIDYLSDIGEAHPNEMPIKIGRNLKSSSVEIDPTQVITRLVPLGAVIEAKDEEGNAINEVASPRVTIASVNGGNDYLDIPDMQSEFDIVCGSVTWNDVHEPATLKAKAQQWITEQTASNESWTVDAAEIGVDNYKVHDSYPFINPAIAPNQLLRVVEKKIDFMKPKSSQLSIGSKTRSLVDYQAQNKVLKSEVNGLTGRVIYQSRKLATLSQASADAETMINDQQEIIDQLQQHIGDGESAGVIADIKQLSLSIDNLGKSINKIGGEVSAVQKFASEQEGINTAQTTINSGFEKRITALEKGGETTDE